MKGRKKIYRWFGKMLYVARYGRMWYAAYDGPCGERSYVVKRGLQPVKDRDEMQAALDAWAAEQGLEEWAG